MNDDLEIFGPVLVSAALSKYTFIIIYLFILASISYIFSISSFI